MAPHSLTPQHYGAGEIDIKNSLKVLYLQWDCVKELEKPQGERRGLCSSCGTRPSITRLGNLGGHKIRNRYAVHYILTSLRSWLQSIRTYWVFLLPYVCFLTWFILRENIRLSDLLENEQRNSTGEAANTITLLEQIQLLKMAYSRNENWAGIWKAASANTISLLKQIQLLKMAYSRNENWAGDMFGLLAEQWWHLRIFFLLSWDRETCMRSIYSNILPLQCNFFPGLAIVSKLSCFKGIGNPTDIHGSWGTWLCQTKQASKGQGHLLSCSGQLKN